MTHTIESLSKRLAQDSVWIAELEIKLAAAKRGIAWWWVNPAKGLVSGPWSPTSDPPWLVLHKDEAARWDGGLGAIRLIQSSEDA